MNYLDRVAKLSKGIDDVYSNLHLWPHLTRVQQDKLEKLYKDLTFQFIRAKVIKREEIAKEFKTN